MPHSSAINIAEISLGRNVVLTVPSHRLISILEAKGRLDFKAVLCTDNLAFLLTLNPNINFLHSWMLHIPAPHSPSFFFCSISYS